jgi:hypothetical protein
MSNFKKLVEARMAETGESWATAAAHVRSQDSSGERTQEMSMRVAERSTAIFQFAAGPKRGFKLEALTLAPKMLDAFIINTIAFVHRVATAAEREERDRLEAIQLGCIRAFYAEHGRPWCDECKNYSHELRAVPEGTVRYGSDPTKCSHYDRKVTYPVISKADFDAHDEKVWRLRAPINAIGDKVRTVLYDVDAIVGINQNELSIAEYRAVRDVSMDRIKAACRKAFGMGSFALTGTVPAGFFGHVSVSNHSPSPATFECSLVGRDVD